MGAFLGAEPGRWASERFSEPFWALERAFTKLLFSGRGRAEKEAQG